MTEPGGGDAEHFVHEPGGGTHLVQMANDIGNFFRAEPDPKDAVAGIAAHIDRFWTKRMRQKLGAHLARLGAEGAGLDPLPLEAVQSLLTNPGSVRPPPPGGDAG